MPAVLTPLLAVTLKHRQKCFAGRRDVGHCLEQESRDWRRRATGWSLWRGFHAVGGGEGQRIERHDQEARQGDRPDLRPCSGTV